jgi:hypothetical protein
MPSLGGTSLGQEELSRQEGWPNLEEPPLVVGHASTMTNRGRALSTPLTSEVPVDKRCWRMRGGGAGETTTNEETTINDEMTIDEETTNNKTTMRSRHRKDDDNDNNKMTMTRQQQQQDDDKMTSGMR